MGGGERMEKLIKSRQREMREERVKRQQSQQLRVFLLRFKFTSHVSMSLCYHVYPLSHFLISLRDEKRSTDDACISRFVSHTHRQKYLRLIFPFETILLTEDGLREENASSCDPYESIVPRSLISLSLSLSLPLSSRLNFFFVRC